jgi:hypothetical protein
MKKIIQKIKNASASDVIYFVCFVVSIVLLVVAFITPPPAEIHPSVLKAVGIMGIFSTIAKVGDWIKLGLDIRLKKGDFELQVDGHEEEKKNS